MATTSTLNSVVLLSIVVAALSLTLLSGTIGMFILYHKRNKASSSVTAVVAEPLHERATCEAAAAKREAVATSEAATTPYETIRDEAISHPTTDHGTQEIQQHLDFMMQNSACDKREKELPNIMIQNSAYGLFN